MKASRLAVRNDGSSPARSSKMKVNPPAVPTPAPVSKDEETPPRRAHARNGWRRKSKSLRFRQRCQFLVKTRPEGAVLFVGFLALAPRFQGDKEQGVVSGLRLAQQTETQHGRIIFDPRRLRQNGLHLFAIFGGARQRGGVGQLHVDVDIPLVLLRQKR